MSKYITTPSGIIAPKPKSIPCGYCSRKIKPEKQPKGRVKSHKGQPICTVCYIKRNSKYGKQIVRDGNRYNKDVKKAAETGAENARRREKERVEEVAAQSVQRTEHPEEKNIT